MVSDTPPTPPPEDIATPDIELIEEPE